MSFDGAFTHAIAHELNHLLKDGRVSKINQPYQNEIMMVVRAHRQNFSLILSANPTYARVQITHIPTVNPHVPTNFAMTLRKYLMSGHLLAIQQMGNDRVLRFHFETRNEMGDLENILLIIEIMGRHSNIILVNQSDMTIIDASREISKNKNRYRQILPGFKYIVPPKQDKVDPFSFDQPLKLIQIVKNYPNNEILAHQLQNYFQGFSYQTALELAFWLKRSDNIMENFKSFLAKYNDPEPVLIKNQRGKLDFTVYPFQPKQVIKSYATLSELLDNYYEQRVQKARRREKGSLLIQISRNELKKNRRKQKKLKKTYQDSQHADHYKICGEILTTYLYKVKSGMGSIVLPNFYQPGKQVKIKLSYNRTPSENAQWYFKKYRKMQRAGVYVQKQMKLSKAESNYFDNLLDQISMADQNDLDDIKYELQKEGYLKNRQNHPHRKKRKISLPQRFMSDDGSEILVGKNNLQNDHLTFKIANKRDTWLHTQKIHGSHVIIRDPHPSEKTIQQAANLAAYFSKGRASSNVPVDYVLVKALHKPNGGKPGFVTFRGQSTIAVTPEKKLVQHLKDNVKSAQN